MNDTAQYVLIRCPAYQCVSTLHVMMDSIIRSMKRVHSGVMKFWEIIHTIDNIQYARFHTG